MSGNALFSKLIENFTFGELNHKPRIKLVEKEPIEHVDTYEEEMVMTISGRKHPVSQCFKVVRGGQVTGWQYMF